LGNHDPDARAMGAQGGPDVHAEDRAGESGESIGLGLWVGCPGEPLEALEEHAELGVVVLVGVNDVAAAIENPTGHLRDQSRPVRSVEEGDDRWRTRDWQNQL
jgi:hypothetical protein